jgi:hypothetical protein
MRLTSRRWVIIFASLLCSFVGAVALFNIVVDPLWCFSHINSLNEKAVVIDQRQQKTNRIAFGTQEYDSIIIGSSRTEPIPASEIAGGRAFNYAAPAMYPEEYGDYLEYARSKSRIPLRKFFVGVDFFGSIKEKPAPIKPPLSYFDKSDTPLYRLSTVLAPDTARAWIKRMNDRSYYYLYDRRNCTLIPKDLARYDSGRLFSERLELLARGFYSGDRYSYNEKLPDIYRGLKSRFPDVSFVVFTTPVSRPLFERMILEGRFMDYCRWMRDLVEAFGGVYSFMYLNSITLNMKNYYDADHFFPSVGAILAHRISGVADDSIPDDSGVYVTAANLEQHLSAVRRQADEILARRNR